MMDFMIVIVAAGQVGLTLFGLIFLGKLIVLSLWTLTYWVGTPVLWAFHKLGFKRRKLGHKR